MADVFAGSSQALKFGQKPYADIFGPLRLTPAQQEIARRIEALASARDLKVLPPLLKTFARPDYRPMAKAKGRRLFHTPVNDYFLNLGNLRSEFRVIEKIAGLAESTRSDVTRQNALETLADLYFWSLRPGGAFETRYPAKQVEARLLRQSLLDRFDRLLQAKAVVARKAHEEAGLHWLEWRAALRLNLLQAETAQRAETARQWLPLVNASVPPEPARPLVPLALAQKLEAALLGSNPDDLRRMSDSGELQRIIPEWKRAVGRNATQHSTQHFDLKDHLLNAVWLTRQSPYYAALSTNEKRLVTMAALLHDLGKEGGPCNLREIIPVDRAHPLRSEFIARKVLPSLHYTPVEIEATARVIRYHQVLGGFASSDLPDIPEPSLREAARKIESASVLKMLKALTEGDIRAVKRDSAWFTPVIAQRLGRFADDVARYL